MFTILSSFKAMSYHNNYLIHLRPPATKIDIIVSNLNVVKKNYLPTYEVATRTCIYGYIDKEDRVLRCVIYGIFVWSITDNVAENWRHY